jgi:hypothetical protein
MSNNNKEMSESSGSSASLGTIQSILEEIVTWLKIANLDKVQNTLQLALDTDEKKLLYDLSNGDTQDGVAEKAHVGGGTVSKYWNKWYKIGLMKKVMVRKGQYRYVKNFELEDFGIEIVKVSKGKKPEQGGSSAPSDTKEKIE